MYFSIVPPGTCTQPTGNAGGRGVREGYDIISYVTNKPP